MKRVAVLTAASLLALATAAHAQTNPAVPGATRDPSGADGRQTSPSASTETTPAADDASSTGDIVVTAQRRTENLRDVPIAITVVSGDSIRETGAVQLSDITQRVPSLQFTAVPGTPTFTVRGIGTNSFDYGVESAVGLAIDDVNITLPRLNPINSLADVERVEVLRGPQGLLFGKNTTAGLISVTTKRPQLGIYSNEGRLQVSSRNQIQVYDVVNLPLGDNAALRIRGGYQYQEPVLRVRGPGSIENTRNYNFNGKLLWNVTDRLTAYAIADYSENRGDPGVWTIRSFGAGTTAPGAGNAFVRNQLTALGIVPGPNNRDTAIGAYNANDINSFGGQLSLDYDLGGATITSVTAYRDATQTFNNLEVDSTPLRVYDNNLGTQDAYQFTQELRIASSGKHVLDYVAGLYYYRQSIDATNAQFGTLGFLPNASPILLSQVGGQVNFDIDSKSYAAFAQLTLNVGERLRLIAGGRYTRDEIDNTTGVSAIPGVCSPAFAATGGRVCQTVTLPFSRSASRNADGWSARAGVQYDLAERTNVYATYSRGYKGPAISSINANIFAVDPETVDAYEVGLKTDLLDRRLSLNLAGFWNNFNNFQAQVFDPTVLPQGVFRTGNAGSLRTRGIEAEATVRPARGFSLSGGVTYLDTEFGDYFPPCYSGQTTAQGCTLPGPSFDASGERLPAAPKWSTSVAAAYETNVSSTTKVFANADWSYRSNVFYGVGNPGTVQDGYSLVNATLGVGDTDGKVRVSVFVRNLFDKRYAAVIFPSYFDTGGFSQVLPDNAFRRFGAALEWRF
jgi:iron complex outermembrane receptor protein